MGTAEKDEFNILVEGCVKGDRRCQQRIYEKLYGKMMGLCLRYASDNDEAKDVLQDGFIKVFANIKNYSGNGSFEGWVRRIVVNTAIDSFRKNRSSSLVVDSDYIDRIKDESAEEVDEEVMANIEVKRVLEEVKNLSPAYKMVFNLYVIEGYSHKEIAEQLGISIGTSKSNLSKAKINLKKAFKAILAKHDD